MNNSTNNNRWLFVITLLLLTANIVTLALLWTNNNRTDKGALPLPGPGGQVFEFITHELKLDSAQQEAYRKLRDEHQAGARPLQDSIRSAKDAFFALLHQPNVPDSAIAAASNKASNAVQQLDVFTFKHFQKVRAICNADQQKKFDEIIQDVLHRMAGPKGQGPPPPREGEGPGRMPPPPDGDHPPQH